MTDKEKQKLINNSAYWGDRNAEAQARATARGVRATEAQLAKYYKQTMLNVIGQFEATYNKLLLTIEDGKAPTPADLYKLDTYWKMQGQLRQELQRLGDRQSVLLSNQFVKQYQTIYELMAKKDGLYFNTIDKKAALQMVNKIWCADGKSWSSRIWTNTDRLLEALNEKLIECVVSGKTTKELKTMLQERFGVSFGMADRLVRTEMAHIQTEAAIQRYKDTGVQEVEIWADKDERRCEVCGKLHKTRYPIGAAVPIPAHSNCRCCVLPVVE